MTGKIVALGKPTVDDEVRANMVRDAEAVLEMARAGELTALVIVPVTNDLCMRTMTSGNIRRLHLVGLLAQAQHCLLKEGFEPD
jgi:hypothetical protein